MRQRTVLMVPLFPVSQWILVASEGVKHAVVIMRATCGD